MVPQEDPTARTLDGRRLAILDTEPASGPSPAPEALEAVGSVLDAAKFRVVREGARGIEMARREVEALLSGRDGGLAEIILTFTLDRHAPGRLGDWEALVAALAQATPLQLIDRSSLEPVEAHHLRRLLTSTPNWGDFAERRGWPESDRFAMAGEPGAGQTARPSPPRTF